MSGAGTDRAMRSLSRSVGAPGTVTTRRREVNGGTAVPRRWGKSAPGTYDQGRTLREVSTDARVSWAISPRSSGARRHRANCRGDLGGCFSTSNSAETSCSTRARHCAQQHDAALSATRWSFWLAGRPGCRARRGLTGDPEPAVSGDTSERQRCLYPVGAAASRMSGLDLSSIHFSTGEWS